MHSSAAPGSLRVAGGCALPFGGFLAPRRAEGGRVGGGRRGPGPARGFQGVCNPCSFWLSRLVCNPPTGRCLLRRPARHPGVSVCGCARCVCGLCVCVSATRARAPVEERVRPHHFSRLQCCDRVLRRRAHTQGSAWRPASARRAPRRPSRASSPSPTTPTPGRDC